MAFQQGASLYARYRTPLYWSVNPASQSSLAEREKGDYVGQWTGEMEFSQELYEWFLKLRVPVLDDDLVTVTTGLFWAAENSLIDGPLSEYQPGAGTPQPGGNPETPAGTGTTAGGGQPQTQHTPPPPAKPGSTPAPTSKPGSTATKKPNPVVNFLGTLGAGGKASDQPATVPTWLKVGAVVVVVGLLMLAGWQWFRKS